MTLALACVVAAGLMPYLFTGIAKFSGDRFDNRKPREWQARLQGMPQRAHAAHLNSFEAFPLFATAVLAVSWQTPNSAWLSALALAFVLLRLLFGFCYLADRALLRSLVWLAAFICNLAIFGLLLV